MLTLHPIQVCVIILYLAQTACTAFVHIQKKSPLLCTTVLSKYRMQPCDAAMHPTYQELATYLAERYLHSDKQVWIGIAGGPGAGKSTLSSHIVELINKVEENSAVVLPMDGFHYSRAELRAMGEAAGSPYTYEQLLARRGSPWTFDAPSIVAKFKKARLERCGVLPTYSRQLSDPVPDGVELLKTHKIVLVEGNYLLNYDDSEWGLLQSLFDEKWFIACASQEEQRQRLIRRHMETWTPEKTKMFGAGEAGAAVKADSNDVMNAQFVDTHRKYADRIIISL